MQRLITAFSITAALLLTALWVAPPASAAPLKMQSPSEGVRYVTGGVSDAEQEALKAASKDFDLKVTLANEHGAYVADVELSIANAKGKQLLEAEAGPIFLVDLPDGRYVVKVSAEGRKPERRRVTIGEGQQRVHFTLESASPSDD